MAMTAMTIAAVTLAGSQQAAAQSTPTAPRLGTVTVSPALKTALANKKKVTPAALAQYLTYSGNTPLLRVKSGRTYALEPVDAPSPTPAKIKPAPIPPEMQKYAAYVNAFTAGPPAKGRTLRCRSPRSPIIVRTSRRSAIKAAAEPACADNRRYGFGETIQLFGQGGGTGALSVNNTNYLEAFLDMGFDIVGGFWLTGTDWSDGTAESGVIDVQLDSYGNPIGGEGGHAMLIVGYNRTFGYFIVKNSYGTEFGCPANRGRVTRGAGRDPWRRADRPGRIWSSRSRRLSLATSISSVYAALSSCS